MSEVIEYLDSKGIEYQQQGHEVLMLCPYCRKEKLSINIQTGLGKCWVCEAQHPDSPYVKTHISKIQKEYGDIINISLPVKNENKQQKIYSNHNIIADQYHMALLKNKKAIKYLMGRGLTLETIERFKLGFVYMKDQEWISIPSYYKGDAKLLKYRKLPPDTNKEVAKCIREYGSESILFNQDVLDEYDEVILCEGEIDAITLIQQGYENVIGVTVGAGTLSEEWYELLLLKSKIYLVFDNDNAGQEAARNVWAQRLGVNRVWNVLLPDDEDVNSYFLKYNKEDFEEVFKEAQRFRIEGISSMSDVLIEMYQSRNSPDKKKFPLPWDNINRLIGGGLKKKHLTIIGASGGIGKTTLTLQLAHWYWKTYGIKSLYFCLEMPEDELVTKIIQLELDLSYGEIDYNDALFYKYEIGEMPLYFGYSSDITAQKFYNTVKEARNRYGCEMFIFDNLHLMVTSDNESDYSSAIKMFKRIPMELNVFMILISQPRKVNTNRDVTAEDLKGSSAIRQGADEILILNRKRMEESVGFQAYDPETFILNDKARFFSGGRQKLMLEGDKSKFITIEEAKEKGIY